LSKQFMQRKSERKHGKTWHERGPTYENARRLYIKYPLVPAVDIGRILGVTKQAIFKYVKDEPDLTKEQEKRREEALVRLKREEGL
jgi:hypothetical protein